MKKVLFNEEDRSIFIKRGLLNVSVGDLTSLDGFGNSSSVHNIAHFDYIDDSSIKEGFVYSNGNGRLIYRSDVAHIVAPRVESTIVPGKHGLSKEDVGVTNYHYWVPSMLWLVTHKGDLPGLLHIPGHGMIIPTLNATGSCTISITGIPEELKYFTLCHGGSMKDVLYDQGNPLASIRQKVNRSLTGRVNTDTRFRWVSDYGYGQRFGGSYYGSTIHKYYLNLSFIHNHVIHNKEEATLWWEKVSEDFEGLLNDLIDKYGVEDPALLEKYSL